MSRNKSKIRILQIILQCNGGPMFDQPIENNKHCKFEWRGQGRGVDSFVLRSYPIWVQCLNNFVADCLNRKSSHTSLRKLIAVISLCWNVRPLMAFSLLCLTSSCLNKNNIKRFRYFQSVTFRVTLNMPWHRALWRVVHNFLFSPLSKRIKTKHKVKRMENLIDFEAIK